MELWVGVVAVVMMQSHRQRYGSQDLLRVRRDALYVPFSLFERSMITHSRHCLYVELFLWSSLSSLLQHLEVRSTCSLTMPCPRKRHGSSAEDLSGPFESCQLPWVVVSFAAVDQSRGGADMQEQNIALKTLKTVCAKGNGWRLPSHNWCPQNGGPNKIRMFHNELTPKTINEKYISWIQFMLYEVIFHFNETKQRNSIMCGV